MNLGGCHGNNNNTGVQNSHDLEKFQGTKFFYLH